MGRDFYACECKNYVRLCGVPRRIGMTYRNKKTGKLYKYLADGIDCTNRRDGTPVVIYAAVDKSMDFFVREKDEIEKKFEPVPKVEAPKPDPFWEDGGTGHDLAL